jgi:hypothetical protein
MEFDALDGRRRPSLHVRLATVLGLTLVALGFLAAPSSAQNTTQITVEASEDCPESTFCFEITGSLDEVEPGDVLDITFENPEDNVQEHNLYLADREDANTGDESTPGNRALANTEDVSPGNETTISTEVPDNIEAVYMWCTIRAHEQQGMNREAELAGIEEGGGENGSPGFGVGLAAGALLGVAVLARRR